jgi:hypothetical protein
MTVTPMATGTASSRFYALVDDRFCAMRSAGAEMAMKHLWSRSTSKTLAPTRNGCESELARADTV